MGNIYDSRYSGLIAATKSREGRPFKFESAEELETLINLYFDDCDTTEDTDVTIHEDSAAKLANRLFDEDDKEEEDPSDEAPEAPKDSSSPEQKDSASAQPAEEVSQEQ